jgi:hypothetical protein
LTRQVRARKANGSESRMFCRKTLNRHLNQADLAAWDKSSLLQMIHGADRSAYDLKGDPRGEVFLVVFALYLAVGLGRNHGNFDLLFCQEIRTRWSASKPLSASLRILELSARLLNSCTKNARSITCGA